MGMQAIMYLLLLSRSNSTQSHWFGSSAHISSQCIEPLSQYSFIPVQRLAHRCAHGVIDVDFCGCNDLDFLTVPLHSQSCF